MVKPNQEEQKAIDHVECIVCKFFDVNASDIVSDNKKSNATMARGYIFYILHVDKKISTNKIANTYLRTARAVFWHVNKIKSLMKQRAYKEIYQNLCACL